MIKEFTSHRAVNSARFYDFEQKKLVTPVKQ
jgi:hypothetical protein